MPEFVGFQSMGILVPYGITFDAVGVFGLAFHLLFKFCSTYRESVKAKSKKMFYRAYFWAKMYSQLTLKTHNWGHATTWLQGLFLVLKENPRQDDSSKLLIVF